MDKLAQFKSKPVPKKKKRHYIKNTGINKKNTEIVSTKNDAEPEKVMDAAEVDDSKKPNKTLPCSFS